MKTWSVWFRADCVQVAMYKWRRWSPTVRTPTRPVKRVNFTCCGNFIVNNFSKVILPVTAYGIDQTRLPNVRMNLQFVNIAYPLATLSLHSDTLLCLTTERRLVMKLIERSCGAICGVHRRERHTTRLALVCPTLCFARIHYLALQTHLMDVSLLAEHPWKTGLFKKSFALKKRDWTEGVLTVCRR